MSKHGGQRETQADAGLIIVLGDVARADALRLSLEASVRVTHHGHDVGAALRSDRDRAHAPAAIVVFGPIAELSTLVEHARAPILSLGAVPPAGPAGSGETDAAGLFFASAREPDHARLRQLILHALATAERATASEEQPLAAADAQRLARILAGAQRLGGLQQPWTVAAHTEALAIELSGATRAYCQFFDEHGGELWRPIDPETTTVSAVTGLVGCVARTGVGLRLARADAEPDFTPSVDDPDAPASSGARAGVSLLIEAVTSPREQVHAILSVVADAGRPPFDEADAAALGVLAEQLGAVLHRVALRERVEASLRARAEPSAPIREEAWRSHLTRGASGDLLRVGARWPGALLLVVLALSLAAAVLASVAEVSRYSTGPAVVQASARSELTALAGGTIREVLVAPGAEVHAGQIVAELHGEREATRREQLAARWEAALRRYLAEPDDLATRTELLELRAALVELEAQLRERVVRAPRAGRLVDLRVEPGQHVEAGEVIAAVVDSGPVDELVAFLPGTDAPRIGPGVELRFAVEGYPFNTVAARVVTVSDGALGAREAQRHLGPGAAELDLRGPVVVVRAELEQPNLAVDGVALPLRDGMLGRAELRTHSEPLALALLPWLRRFDRAPASQPAGHRVESLAATKTETPR
ncbi:HlyD family efflux transporter periplasmic adaptor subunit [Enhygromyxa salina]|uniref:Biotin-requiring enzyme n=1 Tax=Enhygromyxa salina TaxID=215803 RepID=A0A2S9YU16_9BACT|nr:HlyD family efflux transporter periplasmic adaptor subunit [Enhygromyxa salina]PRQ08586.1 Biotin-requiring enzyme [Enhygromyxa salina]